MRAVIARIAHVIRSPWTARFAACVLAGIFLWAGFAKLRHEDDFFNAVAHYKLLTADQTYRLVLILPKLEIALGVALLIPIPLMRRLAACALFALLVLFTGGILKLWFAGDTAGCGCFGGLGKVHPAWSVARNVALIGCALLVFCRPKAKRWWGW